MRANPERCYDPDCNKALKPIWKDDPKERDTWFYHECDTCSSFFCKDHAWTDDDGVTICACCYENKLIRERSKQNEGSKDIYSVKTTIEKITRN